jgi:hypothetical protein
VAGACCSAPPWALEDLAPHLGARVLLAYGAGMRRLAVEAPREAAERAAARAVREAETARIGDAAERVRRLRLAAVEEDLTLRCPRCATAFADFRGCAALYCSRSGCGAAFCALCLKDCGGDRDAHAHVKAVHAKPWLRALGGDAMYFFTGREVAAAQKGVLTDLLSQHDFRCIWAARTRPSCGGCAAVLCCTVLLRGFTLLYSALLLYCCQVHLGCTQPACVRRSRCFTLCFLLYCAALICFTMLYSLYYALLALRADDG